LIVDRREGRLHRAIAVRDFGPSSIAFDKATFDPCSHESARRTSHRSMARTRTTSASRRGGCRFVASGG